MKKLYLSIFSIGIGLFVIWGIVSLVNKAPGQSLIPSTLQRSDATTALTGPYSVVKVIDGDTIDVMIDNKEERIRLIGIDTPETVDPRKPVQCFGQEASNKAKELLSNKSVKLESDKSQGERDKYDRLLRYVFLTDDTNFNGVMIREGYAHGYTYNLPYKYQSQFKEAEREAREAERGLWAANTCGGDTTKSVNPSVAPSSVVKKSNTGICHAPGSTYYEKTTYFTPYKTLQECLDSGGRLPKR